MSVYCVLVLFVKSAVCSVSLVFRRRGHDHLFTPEVPEGRHVEGHVGENHHVLAEREQGVNCRDSRETLTMMLSRLKPTAEQHLLPVSQNLLWRLKKYAAARQKLALTRKRRTFQRYDVTS